MRNKKIWGVCLLGVLACHSLDHFGERFQGAWQKEGKENLLAFRVEGDSLYPVGLERGFHYELQKDTLLIHFSDRTTKNTLLFFNGDKLRLIDHDVTGDTLTLTKMPQ